MYSKIAEASSALVSQCRRSNSSSCKVPKKLSAIALSRASPTEPIEPRMPAARSRLPKAQEVYCDPWSVCITVPASRRLRRHMAICRASTTSSARESVDHSRQVDLALGCRVLGDIADPEHIRSVDCELAVHEVI